MENNKDTRSGKARGFLLGNLYMLLAAIFWGVNISVTKNLIPQWLGAGQLASVRILGGCLLFWLASMCVKNQKVQKADWKRLILGGLIGIGGFLYLFMLSLRYANPIDISIIMTLPPTFVILIGVVFMHQRPSLTEYAGVAISFVGAAIVILAVNTGSAGSDNLLGDLLSIGSTACFAFYLVIIEGPSRKYKPVTMLRWVFLFGAIPALFFVPSLFHADVVAHPAALPWLEIAFILICPTFLAYFLTNPAMKLIGAEAVSLYQYMVPVFAAISAVLMKLDRLRWMQVLAMIVIIVGMVLTDRGKRQRKAV